MAAGLLPFSPSILKPNKKYGELAAYTIQVSTFLQGQTKSPLTVRHNSPFDVLYASIHPLMSLMSSIHPLMSHIFLVPEVHQLTERQNNMLVVMHGPKTTLAPTCLCFNDMREL